MRSHHCGELGPEQLGQEVTLCGWASTRRDHGGLVFVDLRDRYGLTQVVFDPAIAGGADAHKTAGRIRNEFVLWCKGKVRRRPEGMTNPNLKTGEIEVACTGLKILSEAKTPPFPIEDQVDVAENIRLKYRYLDLRRPALQRNIIIRHQACQSARQFLNEHGFVEVETPSLYKSTPEGARDFIVPSRLNPGAFYALPQSPQTLKQLLMVAGFDRYYQIARCFRDEDLRADRQPEFSQIDIELSFLDEELMFSLMEGMVAKIWKDVRGIELKTPFQRMSFTEAMNRFGSDKPDTRFGLELTDLSEVFAASQFQVFRNALTADSRGRRGSIRAIALHDQAEAFSRKDLDDLSALAVQNGAKGLLWIKVQASGEWQSPASKYLTDIEKERMTERLGLRAGSLVLIVADTDDERACTCMGAVRLALGRRLKLIPGILEGTPSFLWVTGFPLLEFNDKDKRYYARHHPFTRPRDEWVDDFVAGRNLDKVEAAAYDLVLNGQELAGGSLRIFRTEVQDAMFRALGISSQEAQDKFGFFLEALGYGTPPHGGIAFGVERLTGMLAGADAIREVMAFPKTQKGHCLMSGSPSMVSPEQLVEAGITLLKRS